MYSTPAEASPPTPSAYSFHDRSDARPTIEQIAMGLHISRTPHVLPSRSLSLSAHPHRPPFPHAHSHPHRHLGRNVDTTHGQVLSRPSPDARRASMSAIVLPPPPARSSLKKPPGRPPTADSATLAPSASDASLSTLATQTSSGPATPRSISSAPATPAPASFPGKLRLEMLRLLPGRRAPFAGGSGALTVSSDADADSVSGALPPRKSVRFLTGSQDGQPEET